MCKKNFERWKELATLTSKEQDTAKLTELASEMSLFLTQKTPYLDPPLREHLELATCHGRREWNEGDAERSSCFDRLSRALRHRRRVWASA
jgi:hypothetical protein